MNRIYTLLCIAGILCIVLVSSSSIQKSIPTQDLSAQVAVSQTPPASGADIEALQKRLADLLAFLETLSRKANSLPDVPPPLLEGDVQLVGTGDRAGRLSASFGSVPIFEHGDITLQVINKASRAITFIEISGLGTLFHYKGGAFPGTNRDDACQKTIPGKSTCTVTVTFSPAGVGADYGSGLVRMQTGLTLKYLDGSRQGETLIMVIGGFSDKNSTGNLLAIVDVLTHPTALGESRDIGVRIGLKDSLDTSTVFFKNVSVAKVTEPFSLLKNDCKPDTYQASCFLKFILKPLQGGVYSDTITFSLDTGAGTPLKLSAELKGVVATFDPSQSLLIVYNSAVPESVLAKDYYLTHRPGIANANMVAVNYPTTPACASAYCLSQAYEIMTSRQLFRDKILLPITTWKAANPNKKITDIVLMRGIPSRPQEGADGNSMLWQGEGSTQMILHTLFSGAFVTSLDMGSLGATRAYVDKLALMHSRMKPPSILISSNGTGYGGAKYYFSDAKTEFPDDFRKALQAKEGVFSVNPEASIDYRAYGDSILTTAQNVLGFVTWGEHGGIGGDYAINDTLAFTGNSGWYLMETFESYNGTWTAGADQNKHFQGNFIKWFSEKAFKGDNYVNTPVGAVTHVWEPNLTGTNDPQKLFACWENKGWFSKCAWGSRVTPLFQAVGDPWVTR